MRIALLTPMAPAPHHVNGGTTRQYELFKRLIELGHEVCVIGVFPHTDEPYIDELRKQGFEVVPWQRPASRLREALSAILRKPSILLGLSGMTINELIGSVYWVDLRPIAQRALAEQHCDVICIEVEYAARWIDDLETDAPVLLTIHDLEAPQHARNAKRHRGLGGLVRRENARRARNSERRWVPRFDALITMSASETTLLREVAGELPPTFEIGNGADVAALSQVGPDGSTGGVLFTGTMAFPPNASAAKWLATAVWPLVRERAPEATLRIVGRDPSAETLALGELAGVEVHADVPDMTPFFEQADVCCLPMLEGGGTRLKLAEAMAAGRPVVATTNGATGVDVADSREVLIADGEQAFADAIVRLLDDRDLRVAIGQAGRRKAIEQYDWKSLGDKLARSLEQVVAEQSG